MLGIGLPELLVILTQLLIFLGVPIVLFVWGARAFRRIHQRLDRMEEVLRRRE